MASALHCLAFLFLLLTFLAIAISFSCPEWVMKPDTLLAAVNLLLIRRPKFTGLWLLCGEPSASFRYGNCEWLFANDFRLQKQQPDWFLAVQILFSLALGISALAVIFGSCAAVCRKTCRGFSVTCGFLNLTFLLLVASVALFWAEAHYKWDVRPTGNTLLLGWCFWLALAATGTSLISTIMYYFLSRRDYRASY